VAESRGIAIPPRIQIEKEIALCAVYAIVAVRRRAADGLLEKLGKQEHGQPVIDRHAG
jgi:hypothetical protein